MALKACTVVIHDLNETAHAIDVTAKSLYEAIAQALAALRGHEWVGEIGRGLTTVTVKVRHPEVTHVVKIQDFENWCVTVIDNHSDEYEDVRIDHVGIRGHYAVREARVPITRCRCFGEDAVQRA